MVLPDSFIRRTGEVYYPEWIDSSEHYEICIIDPGHLGGQAEVCKVEGGGTYYALKVYRGNSTKPETIRQIGLEYRAKFDDSYFVKPISRCQISQNRTAILFPWVEGTTLGKFIHSKTLSKDDKLKLMIEIVQALECLHAKGWTHNDLKDSNIMVVDSNTTPKIRIIDFALASENKQDLTFQGNHHLVGKKEWIAPEMHKQGTRAGIQHATEKSDVWALGCVLLYIETGMNLWDYLEFPQFYSSEDFIKHCKEPYHNKDPISDLQMPNSTIDDPLRQIMMRCLNVKRDLRPTALELVGEIQSLR